MQCYYSKATDRIQDLRAAHISTMQGHPSILHTVTRGESILCVEMNYTGLAHEVQKPFIPHSTHSPTPGAPAFTTGAGL